MLDDRLAELERLLYGNNYAVFLRAYRTPYHRGASTEWYVSQALGSKAVVGAVTQVSLEQMHTEVEESLRFSGDDGSGPKPEAIASPDFNQLLAGVLAELNRAADDAELLSHFFLFEGHPAYPVFWDFGFVIAGPRGGLVFIGSSSD